MKYLGLGEGVIVGLVLVLVEELSEAEKDALIDTVRDEVKLGELLGVADEVEVGLEDVEVVEVVLIVVSEVEDGLLETDKDRVVLEDEEELLLLEVKEVLLEIRINGDAVGEALTRTTEAVGLVETTFSRQTASI